MVMKPILYRNNLDAIDKAVVQAAAQENKPEAALQPFREPAETKSAKVLHQDF